MSRRRPAHGEPELREDLAVRVLERPRELRPDDRDLDGVLDRLRVLVEHDPGVDRERGHQKERDHRPDDLERRVAVNRLAVAQVTGLRAEEQHRVRDHTEHDRDDDDRDDRREPVGVVDAAGFHARLHRQPRDQDRDRRGDGAHEKHQQEQLEKRSPTHRAQPYWIDRTRFGGTVTALGRARAVGGQPTLPQRRKPPTPCRGSRHRGTFDPRSGEFAAGSGRLGRWDSCRGQTNSGVSMHVRRGTPDRIGKTGVTR